jgi:hypothetical protein
MKTLHADDGKIHRCTGFQKSVIFIFCFIYIKYATASNKEFFVNDISRPDDKQPSLFKIYRITLIPSDG